MEKFENKLKIGLSEQGTVEVLKGHEGEFFEGITFKSFKNTKGKETFKSSSPDRKIIILSPLSQVPESGQAYRVLILEDTEPNNPSEGKMIATIVTEDTGDKGARELAIEIRNEYEKKRTEGILTPEDRERLAILLKESNEVYVNSDPFYYDDGHAHDPEDIKEADEQKAQADRVIELRRQLRSEGSKAVTYILEYARTPNPSTALLLAYSQMLYFAASPKDAKKVVDFFSVDAIAKNHDRSIKNQLAVIMNRIGTAADIDSLKTFFDKAMESQYGSRFKVLDADGVLGVLGEIEEKTIDPVGRAKVAEATQHIRKRIEQIGGRPSEIEPAVGPDKLQEEYEEKFLDIELQDGIRNFVDYCKNYIPERDVGGGYYHYDEEKNVADMETAVRKLQSVLETHGASERLPVLINRAYWTLTEEACTFPKAKGYDEAISEIQELTGIPLDYGNLEKDIQTEYGRLLRGRIPQERIDLARNLFERTKVRFKAEPEIIQARYADIILHGTDDPFADLVEVIQELSGVRPDFVSLEPKVQQFYQSAILFGRGHGGDMAILERAKNMYKATGIRPIIDPDEMQQRYGEWLHQSFGPELLEIAESITGIRPDFSGLEDSVQNRYEQLVARIGGIYDSEALSMFRSLKKISKIEPVFDPVRLGRVCLEKIKVGRGDVVGKVKELTGMEPDFRPFAGEIGQIYFYKFIGLIGYDLEPILQDIKNIQELTGIKVQLSEQQIGLISENVLRQLRKWGKLSQIFTLGDIVPEMMPKVLGQVLIGSLSQSDTATFRLAREKMKALGVEIPASDITKMVQQYLRDDPRKVVRMLDILNKESKEDEQIFLLHKTIAHDPWVVAVSKLEKIQGIAANAENDPWEKEFRPFMANIVGRGLIYLDREEDAELVVSFIEMMGMNNLPDLFGVYADCQRQNDPGKLSPETVELCSGFGIKPRRKDGSLRFKSSLELFNELRKAVKGIQTELLSDSVPDGLSTALGQELFNKIKGTTQFERSHDFSKIVETWKEAVQGNPSLAELPPGFKETTIKAPLLGREKSGTNIDQSTELDALMASQEINDVYLPLAQSWELACRGGVYTWFSDLADRTAKEEHKITELLTKSPEQIDTLIAAESDPKLQQALMKKAKALQNPKGRQGIERQAEMFRQAKEKTAELHRAFEVSAGEEGDYVKALEVLNELDGVIPLQKEIRELSAFHMYDKVMSGGFADRLDKLFLGDEEPSMVDKIYGIHKISKDYVEEHYLHHLQDQSHTEHTPFSPKLLEKLNIVWQQQLDKKTGYLPLTILKNKLDHILGVGSGKSRKEIDVSMVPVSGLLHIYSGDLGDSCHTSKHRAMAMGEFPNLRTWVYATNRGKPNEELRGSVLAIQAEKTDGVPVLVVRANNPSENFIQSVDADAFVINVLKEAVETAKRFRAERIKKTPSLPTAKLCQVVAVPMDDRGMASTNRQPINNVYRERFIKCKKIALKSTSETNFNEYQVWDDTGSTPSVVIWEIDEDGNEKWHGNWKQRS